MTRKEKKNGRHWGKRAAAGLLAGILALGAPAAVLADTGWRAFPMTGRT